MEKSTRGCVLGLLTKQVAAGLHALLQPSDLGFCMFSSFTLALLALLPWLRRALDSNADTGSSPAILAMSSDCLRSASCSSDFSCVILCCLQHKTTREEPHLVSGSRYMQKLPCAFHIRLQCRTRACHAPLPAP